MSKAFTIVATCFNHCLFLPKMVAMLEAQEFQDFELVLVDNNSTDGSREWISTFNSSVFPVIKILNEKNLGLCKAFNAGVKRGSGKYVIDLSPDDYFVPHKLNRNFALLEQEGAHLLFSDCEIHTPETIVLHSHQYPFLFSGKGNYFCDILARHCLASATGVYSRELFLELGGYDEELAYEDFDFMTRASKSYELVYDHEVLVHKNEVVKGWSADFSKRESPLHESTVKICEKLKRVCSTPDEKKALKSRVKSEVRAQLRLMNLNLVWRYCRL